MFSPQVAALTWADPASLLEQYHARHHWLAPPQVYELGRLLQHPHQAGLDQFARNRRQAGLTSWLPIRRTCQVQETLQTLVR